MISPRLRFWLLALSTSACSLVLDDPLAFTVAEKQDRIQVLTDRPTDMDLSDQYQPNDGPPPTPDLGLSDLPVDLPVVDAATPGDLLQADVDPRGDVPADACAPAAEHCNGLDDDCDGRVDEADVDLCQPCGRAGQTGLCAIGAWVCEGGSLRCATHLPLQPSGPTCNLQDDDCDGRIDEAGDRSPTPTVEQATRVAGCGPRPGIANTAGDCGDGTVGCGAPHACVQPGCRQNCTDNRGLALDVCGIGCDAEPRAFGACVLDCVRSTEDALSRCLEACPVEELGATRFTCGGGVEGPVCVAVDCPNGARPQGQACVPNVEICNNGLDDDGDGLVDGTLVGDDPCAADFDQRGLPSQMGRCSQATPGTPCEDADRMEHPSGASGDELGDDGGLTPRMIDVSYRFAVDREEVSIRAYAECVSSGCCLAPNGVDYRRALGAMADGRSPARPEAVETCPPQVDPANRNDDVTLPDTPVTGVSWCMARDFCNWAGKRLPTEFEWEHGASGATSPGGPRRSYSWGPQTPPACSEDQCCRAPGFVGALPAACRSEFVNSIDDLPDCLTDVPPEGVRQACLASYGAQLEQCDEYFYGPSPVYGNQDGVSPDGLLNMGGNVSEWVFDWMSPDYSNLSTSDPVGAGCDATPSGPKRRIRGRDFTARSAHIRALDRFALFESTRIPTAGFRCGRTLTDDETLCDPGVPNVNARCRPAQADVPACPGPDFQGLDPGDVDRCGGVRRQSTECTGGLGQFCPSDEVAGCGSFIVSRLEAPLGNLADSDAVALLNATLNGALAPRGGSTLFAISVDENFDLVNGNWRAHMGSAEINADGELVWLGIESAGICERTEVASFELRTVAARRELAPVCRVVSNTTVWMRETPVSLPFSGFGMEAQYEPADATLTGTILFVMTLGDAARAQFGDPAHGVGGGVDELLARLIDGSQSLCGFPLGLSCLAQPLFMPGCENTTCTDPLTCRGYLVPMYFEAIRAPRAGLDQLTACPAPAP